MTSIIAMTFLIGFSAQNAFSHGNVDQETSPFFDGTGGSNISSNILKGQVFVPTVDNLIAVDVALPAFSIVGATLDFTIHQGTDSFNVPGVEFDRIGTLTDIDGDAKHFELDSPVPLIPGQPHILEIIWDDPIAINWLSSSQDTYSDGDAVFCNIDTNFCGEFPLPGFDHSFRTYFEPETLEIESFNCYTPLASEPPSFLEFQLIDQFFEDGTLHALGVLETFCASADKTILDTGETFPDPFGYQHHITCYGIDGEAPGVVVELTDQFGTTQHEVGSPIEVCAPADKGDDLCVPGDPLCEPNGVGLQVASVSQLDIHWKCYEITGESFPTNILMVDQFDINNLQTPILQLTPNKLCTPATKISPAGGVFPPEMDTHLKCYAVDPVPLKGIVDVFFDQFAGVFFPPHFIDVALNDQICVKVEKTIVEDDFSFVTSATPKGTAPSGGVVNPSDLVTITGVNGVSGDFTTSAMLTGPAGEGLPTAAVCVVSPITTSAFDLLVTCTVTDTFDTPGTYCWNVTVNETGPNYGSSSDGTQFGADDTSGNECFEIDPPIGENGCTPGYWKANATFKKDPANAWTVEQPDETLGDAGIIPQHHDTDTTLLEALSLRGGDGSEGMEGNLLRHCVAAKLNAENPTVAFGIPNAVDVIAACNVAMETEDRDTMETLKNELDEFNNASCNINMKGESTDSD